MSTCKIEINNSEDKFLTYTPYDREIIDAIKNIPGRRYHKSPRPHWTIPVSQANLVVELAENFNFVVAGSAQSVIDQQGQMVAQRLQNSQSMSADVEVEGLGGTLRPFQRAAVAYVMATERTFIADEMGLGKTVEALASLQGMGSFPALIVCPASLKLNWQREANKWLPSRSVTVVRSGKSSIDSRADIVVINYDILRAHKNALVKRGFRAVVFDESHYLKNPRAERTKAAKAIAKNIPVRLLLTGTPVMNRPQELLSQLDILDRLDDFGGLWEFAKRYCQAHKSRWGWDFSGAAHLDELHTKLRSHCFLRRKKQDVLTELPAKQRVCQTVQLDNRAEYNQAAEDIVSWLRQVAASDVEFNQSIAELPKSEQKQLRQERANSAEYAARNAEQLVRINALKQLAAQGKMKECIAWIRDFLESGEKLVVFAEHRKFIAQLADAFDAPAITGETPVEKRQAYVDLFQNDDDTRLIVLNLKAGGVGLTLTESSNVVFLEQGWTPGEHDQAEDRCHRMGQQNAVTAWYLLAENTIDEQIYQLIERKRAVVDAVTDGKSAKNVNILAELVQGMVQD